MHFFVIHLASSCTGFVVLCLFFWKTSWTLRKVGGSVTQTGELSEICLQLPKEFWKLFNLLNVFLSGPIEEGNPCFDGMEGSWIVNNIVKELGGG